ATEAMLAKIKEVYERYGFDPVETPLFEYTDALGKFLPDTDRPNEGVFSLQDDDDQWMSLRYDLTAPLARHFAQNINELQTPYRTYRAGYVFRNEKPGPGRFRQFMQFDADTVGAPGPAADAEMAMMMADTMEALGIARGDYVVRVNNRKLIDGIFEALGVTGDKRLDAMRALDKLDRLGWDAVQQLLGKGRIDESGDRKEGVGLSARQIEELLVIYSGGRLLDGGHEIDTLSHIQNFEKWLAGRSDIGLAGVKEIQSLFQMVITSGYSWNRIQFAPETVRGLEYYTGTVFECELTFPVTNEKGETVTFGSVAGGGRYDGLVKRFTGQEIPATGFSIGVSRLMTALKNLGKLQDDTVIAPVVVCVMDRDTESLAGYQKMVQELRSAGIRAEMYQGNPKQFGKQLQYADRRGSPIAIIEGSDERERGEVNIKDLVEGLRLSAQITDNEEWRAARPAQRTVKRSELVSTVQEILAQQKAEQEAQAEASQ
ncbi:MAG: histidine--tRNA ligase, partial [Pseudomonadota bacterium]